MSLIYGYFNSVAGDRAYNSDQMSDYFKGLITNGVYQTVGDAMIVSAAGEMNVTVGTGRAIINGKWCEIATAETLAITGADSIMPRWTAVTLTLDMANRLIKLEAIDGEARTTPIKPIPSSDQLILAYIYVAAGATTIMQANITDTRPDSAVCGWITSVVQTLDTSTLFAQWQDAYSTYLENMLQQWDAWFNVGIVGDLRIDTFIKKHYKNVSVASDSATYTVELIFESGAYTYNAKDVIEVYINGLHAVRDKDYSLVYDNTNGVYNAVFNNKTKGSILEFCVYESKIGWNSLVTSDGNEIATSDGNTLILG